MKKRKTGVSLVEVVISAVILAVALAALLASFVSVRKFVNRAERRLTGATLARDRFSSLTSAVNAATWNSGNLAGGNVVSDAVVGSDGTNYGRSYIVSNVAGSDYRQVNMTVN